MGRIGLEGQMSSLLPLKPQLPYLEAWFRHTHLSDFREAESDSTL